MNVLLIVSAVAGFGSAIGHSYLSERNVLAPLLATRGANKALADVSTRRLMRYLWHLPSLIWAQIATATVWIALVAPAEQGVRGMLAYFGVGIYAVSAALNALGLRQPHIGNVLLGTAAITLWFGLQA